MSFTKNTALACLICTAFIMSDLSQAIAEDQPEQQAQEQTLTNQTLGEALSSAYKSNPTIQAARAELRAVQEQLPQAYAGWKPTLAVDGTITAADIDGSNFGGADGATDKDIAFSLNQPIFRGGQTFAEVKAAKAVIQSQISALRSTEQNILLASVTAFMDVLRDQHLLNLEENNRDVIDRQREAAEIRYEVGELTKTDASQARARLARAESDVITVRGDLRGAEAVFQQVIGYKPEKLEEPSATLLKEGEILPATLEEAIKRAEASSPVVLASVFAHKAAKEDVNDVFGELLPEIGLNAMWNRTRDPQPGIVPEQTVRTIGLSATLPLYEAGATRSRIRQAKYTANQRFIQIAEVKRDIRQQVITAWEDLQASKAEIMSRTAEVEAAKIANEGVNSEAEYGSRTVLDALDADQELLDAQVALVTAQRDKVVAEFTLLSVLGAIDPETLGFQHGGFRYKSGKENPLRFDLFDLGVDRIGDTP